MRTFKGAIELALVVVVNTMALFTSWVLVVLAYGIVGGMAGAGAGWAAGIAMGVLVFFWVWERDVVALARVIRSRLQEGNLSTGVPAPESALAIRMAFSRASGAAPVGRVAHRSQC